MGRRQSGSQSHAGSPREDLLERLVEDLLEYSQRFIKRYALDSVEISVQFHAGRVAWVTHTYSTKFPIPGRLVAGCGIHAAAPEGDHPDSYGPALAPDELNARIGLRLGRLLRHFWFRFGLLDIQVENGEIKVIRLAPRLRPAELQDMARRAGGLWGDRRVA
jgi:hypothetical protein